MKSNIPDTILHVLKIDYHSQEPGSEQKPLTINIEITTPGRWACHVSASGKVCTHHTLICISGTVSYKHDFVGYEVTEDK